MNAATETEGATVERLVLAGARILSMDESSRTVRHVISTARLDRSNRMVEPNGWKLSSFRDNPVVLANHEYSIENIIGRASDVRVENDSLVATTQFDSEGLGNVAFRLVQSGLARSWSVGWQGMRQHRIGTVEDCARCQAAGKVDFGTHYTQQELLEYSLVAIPANPDAVMGLQAAGLASQSEVDSWLAIDAADATTEPEQDPEPESANLVADKEQSAAFFEEMRRVRRVFDVRLTELRLTQRMRG